MKPSNEILEKHWKETVRLMQGSLPVYQFAFGYGSGVFEQAGYDYSQQIPMLDFMLVVEDPIEWHGINYLHNRHHYGSLSGLFGGRFFVYYMLNTFPALFFPDIKLSNGVRIKYGVIGRKEFERDLKTWEYLSIAGRMHKPIRFTSDDIPQNIRELMHTNLKYSLSFATYLTQDENLEKTVKEIRQRMHWEGWRLDDRCLKKVVELSYMGDIRTGVAEDPLKVENILQANKALLYDMYKPVQTDLKKAKAFSLPVHFKDTDKMKDLEDWIKNKNRDSSKQMAGVQLFIGPLMPKVLAFL